MSYPVPVTGLVFIVQYSMVFPWKLPKTMFLTLLVPEMKIAEFAKSVNLDEVAHNEPPHLDLHCLPSSL